LKQPTPSLSLIGVSTLTITVEDDAARLVQEAARLAHQPLEHWLRDNIRQAALRSVEGAKVGPPVSRIAPLHPGAMQPTPDFNAPLEEFAPYV
jgi:hypothetical protein